MENSLKQRIVGAVVLIALAVIFLPSILKEKNHQEPFRSEIPAKPIDLIEHKTTPEVTVKNHKAQKALDSIDKDHQTRKQRSRVEESNGTDNSLETAKVASENNTNPGKQKGAELKETAITDESDSSVVSPAIEPSISKQTIGAGFENAAWVIQVASFSDQTNAVSFVSRLKEAGYKTYRRSGTSKNGKKIYRIFVGPFIEKNLAVKAMAKINQVFASNGILLAYDPVKH